MNIINNHSEPSGNTMEHQIPKATLSQYRESEALKLHTFPLSELVFPNDIELYMER
jgi:hypothetical protein